MNRLREALEEIDLEAWIEEYDDTRSGGTYELRVRTCPQCGNEKFKLYVNIEKQRWICYVCEWGRNQADICVLLSEISGRTLFDIRKEILETAIPTPNTDEFLDRLARELDPVDPPGGAHTALSENLESVFLPGSNNFTGVISSKVYQYGIARGLEPADFTTYQLRCASELMRIPGPYLLFPVYVNGQPVAWQGRRLQDQDPKYVGSKSIAHTLWPYDLWPGSTKVVLVEGVFDQLGLKKADIPALCTFGKKLTASQETLLSQLGVREIIFAWDADAADEMEKAALRLRFASRIAVADFRGYPGRDKVDPGNGLCNQGILDWIKARISAAIDIRSTEFLQWRLAK